MGKLKEKNLVVQSNHFSNILDKKMTPIEQKMLAIYISKINPKNPSSRIVTFPLLEYERIMQIKRFNITQLQATAKKLISMPVIIDYPNGGFLAVPTFKKFGLYQNEFDEWHVDIDCSDEVLPYLFDLQKEFYKYELWNILRLNETNHQQMYRLLKQFEKTGERTITIKDLKMFLGLEEKQYPEYKEFNRRVLQGCQKALLENTDIKFTYETIKKGRGGKVYAIKFNIFKNEEYIDQLTLSEFIESQYIDIDIVDDNVESLKQFEFTNEKLEFLAEACDNEFNQDEVQVLFDLIAQVIPYSMENNIDLERYEYLFRKYNEMKLRKPTINRFGYLKTIITADVEVNNNGKNYKTDS